MVNTFAPNSGRHQILYADFISISLFFFGTKNKYMTRLNQKQIN